MPPPLESVKVKLCLVGETAVGKTSLIRRFVLNEFDDHYIPTLGAKIVKRDVIVDVAGRPVTAVLTILDIMGEPSFRDLLKEAYFSAVQGIVAVGDLTRPETIPALAEWIHAARRVSGPVPAAVLGNKSDLAVGSEALDALQDLAEAFRAPSWRTSAKTGAHVGPAFAGLAQAAVEAAIREREGRALNPADTRPRTWTA